MERAQQKPLRKFNGGIDHRIRIQRKSNISPNRNEFSTALLEFTANLYISDSNNIRVILTALQKSWDYPRARYRTMLGEVVGRIFE